MKIKQEVQRHPFIKEMMQTAKTWEKFVPTNKKYRRKQILDHAIRRCDAFFATSNDDTKLIADLGKQFIMGLKYTDNMIGDRNYVMKILEQFSELDEEEKDRWVKETSKENLIKIEQVWDNFCEAVDQRLRYVETFIDLTPIQSIVDYLFDTETVFLSVFGDQYMSTEIKCDYSCSICQKNPRMCNHVDGKFYDGVRCERELINPQLVAVALVSDPADRRLRLWPWRIPEDGHPDLKTEWIPVMKVTDR